MLEITGNQYTYKIQDVAVFQKNDDPFGKLSNMAALPLVVNNVPIRTSEALYQLCKFPLSPSAQKSIIEQKSPMGAKYKSRSFASHVRSDWQRIRVDVMRWCLAVKLAQHYDEFGSELRSTGNRPIVERSKVDSFWGAKPKGQDLLVGQNVLGQLLMELRDVLLNGSPEVLKSVEPLKIQDFNLLDEQIGIVSERDFILWSNRNLNQNDKQLKLPW